MTRAQVAFSLAIAAALQQGAALAAADAGTQGVHNVGKLKYTNKGAYEASVYLYWKDTPDSKEQRIACSELGGAGVEGHRCRMYNQEDIIIDLGNPSKETEKTPAEGAEVWLWINISGGSNSSCRKPNAKFYFEKGSSKMARFSTGGTSKNNNGCTYDGGG